MRRTWKRVLVCSLLGLCIAHAAEAASRDAGRSQRGSAPRHGRVVAATPHNVHIAAARHGRTPRGSTRQASAPSHPAQQPRPIQAATLRRSTPAAKGRHQAVATAPARGAGQQGHASIYSRRFAGRRMADGGRFDPGSDSVASRTLPLGTQARVTNLRNGRSAIVRVRDRGPHVRGRILDVSPGIAERLGMTEAGIAPIRIVALMDGDAPAIAPRVAAHDNRRR